MRNFNCTSSPFVRGVRTAIRPNGSHDLRWAITGLIALISDQWVDSPVPVMEPEEMSEFCEHLAGFRLDNPNDLLLHRHHSAALFGMLRSPEWRKHILPMFRGILRPYCAQVEEQDSLKWCLRNATELLEFTRGFPGGEGLKWWYGMLWFHYDKLDTTVQGDVERIAREMLPSGDGLSDLNWHLQLIEEEVARTQQEVDGLSDQDRTASFGMELRARLVTWRGNYNRLAQIKGGM
jgi:hypothetical protein